VKPTITSTAVLAIDQREQQGIGQILNDRTGSSERSRKWSLEV